MAKGYALAISADDFFMDTGHDNDDRNSEFFTKMKGASFDNVGGDNVSLSSYHAVLTDRTFCETDTHYLQLIPYITYWRTAKSGEVEVLMYQRGSGGGESRLHEKYSVGIGGHIEDMPKLPSVDLVDVLLATATRETEEEIGTSIYNTADSRDKLIQAISDGLHSGTLYTNSFTPVDAVHLAVMISVDLTEFDTDRIVEEEGSITNPQWMSIHKLKEAAEVQKEHPDVPVNIFLENWSLKAVELFKV